jgi:hypothetical protein
VYFAAPLDRRRSSRSPRALALIATAGFLTLTAVLTTPSASAAPQQAVLQQAVPAAQSVAQAAAVAATPVTAAPIAAQVASVSSLRVTGTTTRITVHRVYRTGQVQWINHVLDRSLTDLDGCQAERSRPSWRRSTYRASVNAVCAGGSEPVRAAVARLHDARPWYRMTVTDVPLVGFSLLADLPTGNGEAVPAALAKLPHGGLTFAEGDDVSLSYVGQGVSQAQLDSAVAAFAAALGIPQSKVSVSPLFS